MKGEERKKGKRREERVKGSGRTRGREGQKKGNSLG